MAEYDSIAEFISKLARQDRIAFKRHCILRMHERKIMADEVKEVLVNGEIIEAYPEDSPLPSFLLLGCPSQRRFIHAVVAADKDESMLWVITVYIPNDEEWEKEYRRRKTT